MVIHKRTERGVSATNKKETLVAIGTMVSTMLQEEVLHEQPYLTEQTDLETTQVSTRLEAVAAMEALLTALFQAGRSPLQEAATARLEHPIVASETPITAIRNSVAIDKNKPYSLTIHRYK